MHLREACAEQVECFRETFPDGATFPADIATAIDAGLDVNWLCENYGFLMPLTDDVPHAA